ncbi:MAG: terminase small subunit [Plesiomonas shigelloides]
MSWNLLNDRQRKFVDEYIRNGSNGTQAAIFAGYSENSAASIACENLNKPYIKEALEQRRKDLAAESAASYEWKVKILQRAAEAGLETYVAGENASPRYQSISATVSAVAELNKMAGAHAPEKVAMTDANGNDKPTISIEVVGVSRGGDDE